MFEVITWGLITNLYYLFNIIFNTWCNTKGLSCKLNPVWALQYRYLRNTVSIVSWLNKLSTKIMVANH